MAFGGDVQLFGEVRGSFFMIIIREMNATVYKVPVPL
jgi:hypothetical protein